MSEKTISGDSVIEIGKSVSLSQYQAWFQAATGKTLSGWEFQPWLRTQSGKTLQEAAGAYEEATVRKSMEEILQEPRFSMLSQAEKAFLRDFDREIMQLGYDFGGGIGDGYCWGKYMAVWAKTGAKSKKVAARVFIRESGIVLRLFLNQVDKHRAYLETAPAHIRAVFTGAQGDCSCQPKKENCRMRKSYVIDGRRYEKCSGVVFEFERPTVEKLPDYMALLREFYPGREKGRIGS